MTRVNLRRLLERKHEAALRRSIDEAVGSPAAGEKRLCA